MPFFTLYKQANRMNTDDFSFPKSERLCSHNIINEVFSSGKAFVCYPFRVIYLDTELPQDVHSQVLFSVGKRKFKRAVHRNLLRRRSKEAYRLHRQGLQTLLKEKNQQIAIAMVYISSSKMSYDSIEKGMIKALDKLCQKLSEPND